MSIISSILSSKYEHKSYKPNTIYHNPSGSNIGRARQTGNTNNSTSTRMNIDAVDVNSARESGCTIVAGYGDRSY